MNTQNHHITKLMGAAFAGLSLASSHAATVYNESTDGDLSNSGTPTDLTSTFGNFLSDSAIFGTITTGTEGSDGFDNMLVQMTPGVSASIPYFLSGTSSTSNITMYLYAYTNTGDSLTSASEVFPSGSDRSGTLDFTVPADGFVRFEVSHESSNAAMNYTIGAIPETSTAVLTLAGVAAAALRRRREKA